MAQDALRSLAAIPIFQGLSKKELRRILDQSREERFGPGRDMVIEGSPGGRFFVITAGRAKVLVRGRQKGTLGPGDFFGEMSIIDRRPRSATVQADGEVRAITITSWNFQSLLEESWPMARKVLVALCNRVRDLEDSPTL